ncbi:hypothetical protein Mhun_3005 [Methanospirillum hungatei JF-1]|uniref:Big-1 domain-containing protein n=1 Tax=Methanospirillum hungatei JF-1 (strain ATCC 27890 / DSM 864 / NBRC 100397 / JF-1) TaxID=323259 RepID=Q2FSP9_METHJ|nr:hypothetical protein [Methanospirillum hungatei]ABD42692.1 hypothetical protein Mhun_3005 [Methanospirillum hungatei JF-1]
MTDYGCIRHPALCRIFLFGLLIAGLVLCMIPTVSADFPETHSWNPYEGWDIELSSVAGIGLFPTVEVDWTPKPTAGPLPKVSSDTWVKLAYYPPGTEAGQPAILAGYVGGRNYNAEVTITGKMKADDEFHDIVTTKAQENGVFVWAVPDELKSVPYFQAVAKVSGAMAKSEIVQTSGLSGYVPAESSVPTSPSPGPVIAASTQVPAPASDLPKITSMTLSANNLRPTVGTDVELTGRLVDSSGKGVPGVSITIEVPDYGTDFLPLLTTSTDGDGRFSATISTWEGGGVPVRAVFEGNDKYLACTSNTLTFYASDKKSTGLTGGGTTL